jgi:single-strand DNA-binding protein
MLGFNKVMLMGHVTRDPEIRQIPNHTDTPTSLAEFGLASNRRYRSASGEDREETLFIDCTVFGKQADVIARYVKKGKALFVEGRLRYEAWEDGQGNKRSKIGVIVDTFQFVGGREDNAGGGNPPNANADRPGEGRQHWKQRATNASDARKRPVKVAQADIPF